MRLIALKPLYRGRGVRVEPGESFDATRAEARDLVRRGYAREAEVLYETKVITPEVPAVTAAPPFRDVSAIDPEPAALAALRAAVCAVSDALPDRDPGSSERRKRGRPRTK